MPVWQVMGQPSPPIRLPVRHPCEELVGFEPGSPDTPTATPAPVGI